MLPSKSSAFATDVFKIVIGTTFAQLIVVLASPLLTRLYGPETFGFLAIFTSISSILGVIACMRYELAIMLPKTDEEAANLLGLCFLCVAVVSGLTMLALYFGGDGLLSLLGTPGLAPYLILIPPFVFINGVFLALNYWNSRTKQFGRLSVVRVTSALATIGTQLGAGFAGCATGGSLIGANLVGVSVSTGVLGGQIWRDDRTLLRRSISRQGMIDGLKRYKKFPLIDSSSALLTTISWQLPALLLTVFFSPVVVGFYSLGFMVLKMPMSLIGGAIAQVFFQRASEAYLQGTLTQLVENIFAVLLKLSVLPMLLLAVVGEELFLMIFGAAWSEAGVYAQILSIWIIFWFISSPLSTIISVREKFTIGLGMTILNFSTRFLSLIIGGVLGSAILAMILFSVSGVLVYGFACFVFLKLAGVSVLKTLRLITKSLTIAVLFLIPLIIVKILALPVVVVTLLAPLILIAYGLYVLLTDSLLRNLVTGFKMQYLSKM
jgi:lipopolysaccharide exporter